MKYVMATVGLCLFLAGSELWAAHPLSGKLNRLIKSSGVKESELGLWVSTPNGGAAAAVFNLNAEKSMIPASLSKIATAAAVMSKLTPTYRLKTQLLSSAKVEGSVLKGSLVLRGAGDPSFVSENMWFLVNELTRTEISVIEGDIVVDDSRFDRVRFSEERESVRIDRAYDAPVGGMSMNWNSVNIFVRPGLKAGDPARAFVDVATPYIKLENRATTGSRGGGQSLIVERLNEKNHFGDIIRVSGKIALDHNEFTVYKNISQPDLWAGYNLVAFLAQRGIQVKGAVKAGATPADAVVLASSESKPLAQMVGDMNKFSNNYVAEMLAKTLAAEDGVQPATLAEGLLRVQKYLNGLGFVKGSWTFVSPSGFNRENKMSAAQIGQVLESVHQDFTLYPEYLASLPISAVDGTLKNRFKGTGAERWVRAKTGLLNGVVGLAGYAGVENGKVTTFAFIFNGAAGKEMTAKALFDQLATALVEK